MENTIFLPGVLQKHPIFNSHTISKFLFSVQIAALLSIIGSTVMKKGYSCFKYACSYIWRAKRMLMSFELAICKCTWLNMWQTVGKHKRYVRACTKQFLQRMAGVSPPSPSLPPSLHSPPLPLPSFPSSATETGAIIIHSHMTCHMTYRAQKLIHWWYS